MVKVCTDDLVGAMNITDTFKPPYGLKVLIRVKFFFAIKHNKHVRTITLSTTPSTSVITIDHFKKARIYNLNKYVSKHKEL